MFTFRGFGELYWETYTVQPNDTLGKIAAKFPGVTVDTIAGQNAIEDVNLIYPGQVLDIPIEDTEFEAYKEEIAAQPPIYVPTSPASVPRAASPAPSSPKNVQISTSKTKIPAFLQGNVFGYPKVYVYPIIGLIGAIILIPIIKRKRTEPVAV